MRDYANEHPLPEGLPQEVKIDVISLRNLNHEKNTLRARNAELTKLLENAQITIHLLNHKNNGKSYAGCKDCESVRAAIAKEKAQ
jgi:hypothetical protein